jgi:aldehyde:ferredoxin oxidoreductase
MSRSYWNKIVRANLSDGRITVEEPGTAYFRRYVGGWNLIADTLLREVPAGANPLGPENKLVFAPGVLTGLAVSGAARNAVGARSPLTGAFGASEVGGFWGTELKRAGIDALVVEGASSTPVYLWIKDGVVELRDASHLWGMQTKETWEALQEELADSHLRCAMIGPGGENMVRYACVMSETKDAAGRTGLGAVMGSKKLKAIAVRGTMPLDGADPRKLKELAREMARGVREGRHAATLHQYGTGVHLEESVLTGNLPIRNFRDGEFPAAAEISANTIMERIGLRMEGCFACAVRCKKVVQASEPYATDPAYGGPEYETIAALGSCCGVGDMHAIAYASQLCNAYSLDTISTGVTIAFAMECFEHGLLTLEDTDGLELRFGRAEVVGPLIEKIARRTPGIGDLLAEGVARAAERIGKGAAAFAMHVKGQELPMHEPRFKRALAIGYAASPTGADHCHALHDSGMTSADEEGLLPAGAMRSMGILAPLPLESLGPEKVRAATCHVLHMVTGNCLPLCLFVPWTIEQQAELVRAATGWDVSSYELLKVGERALTLARVFNAREGFTIEDDHLPERLYGPTRDGALAQGGIDREQLRQAVAMHAAMLGWDPATGTPLPARLHELGVSWAVEHLPR